ncbi:hypothetical protein GCM10010964_35660 [Caldovatus sediminis]|uniref:Uncharacterized protein n=1 Tax=Caldovatus sediminis TaxID=2041189 RepID=A0A8J2ZDQ6_9PROT|nr:hypothetical protein [Caldovatus sediminis]GGG45129.1 hypothetical protein GCM10010964_35660 [Caldovatus sediminis]
MHRLPRRPLLLALPAFGAACSADPAAEYLFGIGDPVRGAALNAPRLLGDTAQYAGRPAAAARAVVQLEFLAHALATEPRYAPEVQSTVLFQLRAARAEAREALGIAPDAPPEAVMDRLRAAADALEAGSPARAEAALDAPRIFALGPRATLARLGALPPLPHTREAAGAVAAELDRLERRR